MSVKYRGVRLELHSNGWDSRGCTCLMCGGPQGRTRLFGIRIRSDEEALRLACDEIDADIGARVHAEAVTRERQEELEERARIMETL